MDYYHTLEITHREKYAATNYVFICNEEREDESHLTSGDWKVFGDLLDKFGNLSNYGMFIHFFSQSLFNEGQD